jgi:hypothetical protein
MTKAIKGVFVFGLIAIAVCVTSHVARLPESNCSTSPVFDLPSEDQAYSATVLVKDCNVGETIFYSVRIDARSPPLRLGWFTIYEIEDDERPDGPPELRWEALRTLVIEMPTRTLAGLIRTHIGDDLILVRNFRAKAPDAFPNYKSR